MFSGLDNNGHHYPRSVRKDRFDWYMLVIKRQVYTFSVEFTHDKHKSSSNSTYIECHPETLRFSEMVASCVYALYLIICASSSQDSPENVSNCRLRVAKPNYIVHVQFSE